MTNKHTSLELSKKLQKNGCKLKTNNYWCENELWQIAEIGKDEIAFPAYDILNDICVKYAKEFFGTDLSLNNCKLYNAGICRLDNSDNALLNIGVLLKQGIKQEAEDYIWEHCLFNPENKER